MWGFSLTWCGLSLRWKRRWCGCQSTRIKQYSDAFSASLVFFYSWIYDYCCFYECRNVYNDVFMRSIYFIFIADISKVNFVKSNITLHCTYMWLFVNITSFSEFKILLVYLSALLHFVWGFHCIQSKLYHVALWLLLYVSLQRFGLIIIIIPY